MPEPFSKISSKDKEKLKTLCKDLEEVNIILGAVTNISYTYRDKVAFVVKRIDAMVKKPDKEFHSRGSG